MAKKFDVKLIHNKKNGQFNISIPKRKLSKENILKLGKAKNIKFSLEELY
jgi:hypothetical protein